VVLFLDGDLFIVSLHLTIVKIRNDGVRAESVGFVATVVELVHSINTKLTDDQPDRERNYNLNAKPLNFDIYFENPKPPKPDQAKHFSICIH
jgi:hypothetical protein